MDKSYWVGLGWLVFVLCALAILLYVRDGNLVRGAGFFIAGAGIAPLGLILANMRTKNLKQQIVSTEFVQSAEMLGQKGVVVRSSGIEALRELAIGNTERAETILRILASHVRSSSGDILRGVIEADEKKEKKAILCLPMEKRRSDLDRCAIEEERSMPADVEASLAAIKEIINKKKNGVFSSMVDKCIDEGSYTLDLSNSIFINSALSSTDLTKANLSQIHATNFVFEGTCFKSANLSGAYLNDCSIDKFTKFEDAEFNETKIINMNFAFITFQKATFKGVNAKRKCEFEKCEFDSANFQNAKINRNCSFKDCKFTDANFRGAEIIFDCFSSLEKDDFNQADFAGAKIYASNVKQAKDKLSSAYIKDADFLEEDYR